MTTPLRDAAGRDIAVGQLLPTEVRVTTRTQLVRYSGAARDSSGIHFDDGYARRRGFPSVIVHGFLKAGFLAEMAVQWAGTGSWFRRFGARYRGIDVVGAPIVCRGVVRDVPGPGLVEVGLWTEDESGRTTTTADGVIQLRGEV